MRHLTFIAMLILSSNFAQAKCVARICYSVTLEVTSCHERRDDRPLLRGRVTPGIVIGTKQPPVAQPAPCYAGADIPTNTVPTVEQIEGTREFFYRTESCATWVGRKVTLFAPEPCCHDTASACSAEPPELLLKPLPSWVQ